MGRFKAVIQAFVGKAQAFVIDDVSTSSEERTTYSGNSYRSYQKIIKALADKYQGRAEWGCQPTGSIVDVRAAFIIGDGVVVTPADPKDEAAAEMAFIKAFFDYNDLDREMPQEFAKEGELEGCFLGTLTWEAEEKQVSLRYVSRVETKYEVLTPANDYSWYQGVKFGDGKNRTPLKEEGFVYARFGGRIHKPNEPTPKVGKCLMEIDALSKALRDWREIDNLFAAPVPYIKCENADQAKWMAAAIEDAAKNWKLRKLMVLTGEPGYLSPTELAAVEKEIITLAKIISGATGVPVHFLGLPDLMSNRATAENLMELVAASTSKERMIWLGTYQQIIKKAMDIWNKESGMTKLDPKKVKVTIPFITAAAWQRIIDVYLPLFTADAIDRSTLLTEVPGLDVQAEMKKAEERDAQKLERFKESNLNPENQTNSQVDKTQDGEQP